VNIHEFLLFARLVVGFISLGILIKAVTSGLVFVEGASGTCVVVSRSRCTVGTLVGVAITFGIAVGAVIVAGTVSACVVDLAATSASLSASFSRHDD